MALINILIGLAIIYLAFLIFDKFGLYILAILLGLLIVAFVPILFKWIKLFFTWLMSLNAGLFYKITGVEVSIAWWVGLIAFCLVLIPVVSTWSSNPLNH